MFATALRQYLSLPLVEYDPMRHQEISDLVFGAKIQLDLIDEGEVEASAHEYARLTKFVRQWYR